MNGTLVHGQLRGLCRCIGTWGPIGVKEIALACCGVVVGLHVLRQSLSRRVAVVADGTNLRFVFHEISNHSLSPQLQPEEYLHPVCF